MNFGTIEITRYEGALLQPARYSYKFEGEIFIIPRDMLMYELSYFPKVGERFSIGSTSLVCAEREPWSDNIKAVRDTSSFWIAYFLILAPIARTVRLFYCRAIITLAVWNLAEVHHGEIPSLESIRRRWRRKWQP